MIRTCPACGHKSRVRARNAASLARCGRCRTEIASPFEPLEADPELFGEVVGSARVPVLVDSWAG